MKTVGSSGPVGSNPTGSSVSVRFAKVVVSPTVFWDGENGLEEIRVEPMVILEGDLREALDGGLSKAFDEFTDEIERSRV